MNLTVIALGLICGLVLGATGLGLFLLWRAHALLRSLGERAKQPEEDTRRVSERLDALTSRVQELEYSPKSVAAVPAVPRAGMNLNKRSQALRLHRQGERPDQIATALDLPRQEVELLVKVHRIVMSNV